MADYQEVIQAVRGQLKAGPTLSRDELADLAVTFANLCHEANVRLNRCGEYLRLGCISEATHLAGCQPVLERLIAALQRPDLRAWNELCARMGLTPAPPILDDDLAALRAATAKEGKLRPLLARHRVLAIARAPARDRLKVTRALSHHDSENACWVEECKRLEPLRWAELRSRLRSNTPAVGSAEYEELKEELAENWHLPLPGDLTQMAASVMNAPSRSEIAKQAEEIKRVLLDEDLLLNPPDQIRSAIAQWAKLSPYASTIVEPAVAERLKRAIESWRQFEENKRKLQESKPPKAMILNAAAVPFDPERHFARRTWLYAFLVLMLIAGAVLAVVMNPAIYATVKKILGM